MWWKFCSLFLVVWYLRNTDDFASWPTMPKIFTPWPFTEKACQHLSYKPAGFIQPSFGHLQPMILIHLHWILSLPCATLRGLPVPLLTVAHPISQTLCCAPPAMSPTLGSQRCSSFCLERSFCASQLSCHFLGAPFPHTHSGICNLL